MPGFAPRVLREYALLADGERGVLVGPQGDFAWMCAPRWDSEAVFCWLIGGRGSYAVTPSERLVWGGCYEDGSLIWRSRWTTESGIIECREALAFPGERQRATVLRRVIAVQGPARVRVVLEPAAEFGRAPLRELHQDDAGRWHGRTGQLRLRWSGCPTAVPSSDQTQLTDALTMPEGQYQDLILELSHTVLDHPPPDPDRLWDATETAWRAAIPTLGGPSRRGMPGTPTRCCAG